MTPASGGEAVTVAAAMPFLEQFLAEAEPVWRDVREGRLRSEPFIVDDPEAGEIGLIATAIGLGPRQFLVLGRASDFDRRRESLQTAREKMLEHEQHVRRTGALLGPLDAVQRKIGQLAASSLSADQESLVRQIRDELSAVTKAIETLAPLPKGVRRAQS
jgi:hypothetical protein